MKIGRAILLFTLSLIFLLLIFSSCKEEPVIEDGDKVKIYYKGTLKDGTVFDQTKEGSPFEFEAGSGQVIKGLDQAVHGMKTGEIETIAIAVDDAYGQKKEELKQEVDRNIFPKDFVFEKGKLVTLRAQNGMPIPATILEERDDKVLVDLNHPLAGKDLIFEIEIVEIEKY